jgi:hypothetical protein
MQLFNELKQFTIDYLNELLEINDIEKIFDIDNLVKTSHDNLIYIINNLHIYIKQSEKSKEEMDCIKQSEKSKEEI